MKTSRVEAERLRGQERGAREQPASTEQRREPETSQSQRRAAIAIGRQGVPPSETVYTVYSLPFSK
eukprot:scaffold268_cov134-Isochrysis_galbana.AAC.6